MLSAVSGLLEDLPPGGALGWGRPSLWGILAEGVSCPDAHPWESQALRGQAGPPRPAAPGPAETLVLRSHARILTSALPGL